MLNDATLQAACCNVQRAIRTVLTWRCQPARQSSAVLPGNKNSPTAWVRLKHAAPGLAAGWQISPALARQFDAAEPWTAGAQLRLGLVALYSTCCRACAGVVSPSLVTAARASALALLGAPAHEGDPSRRLTPIHTRLPPARMARRNLPVSAKSKNGLACANAEIAGLQQPW